jgi:UDPglucose--hexose-1-phosphate uridylyltransferase
MTRTVISARGTRGRAILNYANTFVFNNNYAALLPRAPHFENEEDGLLVAESEAGICRVVCFSPRHDLTLPVMSIAEVKQVVDVWCEQFRGLAELPWAGHVQIFENRGALMGASNPLGK